MRDQQNEQNSDERRSRAFNPNEHLLQLKSRDGAKEYLPVQWRLVWFREQCPQGTIDTEELAYDLDREVEAEAYVWNPEKRRSEKVMKKARGYARYRAVATDGKGGRGTGTKSENAANFADFGEKAETGAIGRALAALGYGTQFATDLDEGERIVDSPVSADGTPMPTPVNSNGIGNGRKPVLALQPETEHAPDTAATEQQVTSIRKLCERLSKAEPENIDAISYADARELIARLSNEYRQLRSKAS